jgi:hypothetical protein
MRSKIARQYAADTPPRRSGATRRAAAVMLRVASAAAALLRHAIAARCSSHARHDALRDAQRHAAPQMHDAPCRLRTRFEMRCGKNRCDAVDVFAIISMPLSFSLPLRRQRRFSSPFSFAAFRHYFQLSPFRRHASIFIFFHYCFLFATPFRRRAICPARIRDAAAFHFIFI